MSEQRTLAPLHRTISKSSKVELRYNKENMLVDDSYDIADYSEYPEQFPNQGDYTDMPLLSIESFEMGVTYGHAAIDLGVEGIKAGFNIQIGGYLAAVTYDKKTGITSKFVDPDELNVNIEGSYGPLSFYYKSKFQTGTGKIKNQKWGGGLGSSLLNKAPITLIGLDGKGLHLSPEANLAFGIGARIKFDVSVNFPKRYTIFEEIERNALKETEQSP